ncbi:hypothetical protein RBB50_001450 [Rhinocladiella similis]
MLSCIILLLLLVFLLDILLKKRERILAFLRANGWNLPVNMEGQDLGVNPVHGRPGILADSVDGHGRTRHRRVHRRWEHIEDTQYPDLLDRMAPREPALLQNDTGGYLTVAHGPEQMGTARVANDIHAGANYLDGARGSQVDEEGINNNGPPPAYTFTNQVPGGVDNDHPHTTSSGNDPDHHASASSIVSVNRDHHQQHDSESSSPEGTADDRGASHVPT